MKRLQKQKQIKGSTVLAKNKTKTEAIYQRPWMYPKQEAAIFDPARYSLIEASTKSGKTVGGMVWIAEQAMAGKSGYNYWWVAPSHGQAKIAYRRLKRGLPQELFNANESELTITLANGAVIWFKTGEKPDLLYGEDVYAAVIDEAPRMREEAWWAIRSTLTATRGPVRIIGNVKGRRNWFYKMARNAEAGDPTKTDQAYHKITWRDAVEAGVLDAEEIESARRDLPEAVFKELYEAEPTDDEGNPFGIEAIRACIQEINSQSEPIAWGWDLAKSQDYTVGIALDKDGQTAYFTRFQLPWEETLNRILALTEGIPALLDSTGVGDPIVERLQRKHRGNNSNFEAYPFTARSKQQLMEGLAIAIQQNEISYPDGPIVSELESFEYEYTRTGVRYTAPPGMHDDCVDALALANLQYQRLGFKMVSGDLFPSDIMPAGSGFTFRMPERKKWRGTGTGVSRDRKRK